MRNRILSLVCVVCLGSVEARADVLYDNGPADGTGGRSNVVRDVFGASRALLDDFVIPAGEIWSIDGFHWTHIWDTLPPGTGTGVNLEFWFDDGNMPGGPLAVANVTSYQEVATGNVFFSRDEAASWVEFDPIELGEGLYWFRAQIIGPENNFWLIHEHMNGNEFWVDYEDFNGLEPGTNVFGVPSDLNFIISGTRIPEPNVLGWAALFAAGVVLCRRKAVHLHRSRA